MATRSDSRIAVHSVGEISNTPVQVVGLTRNLKPYFSSILLCGCGGGNRVNDCRMRIRREGADDLDAGLDLGVGRIDDPECGFAARHQCQRGAHAFGHREFRLGGLPRPEFLQRRLGVFADRNRLDVAGRDLAVAGQLGEIEALPDRHIVDPGILRRDQHNAIAEQIDPRRFIDVLFPDGVIHPVGIGGDEHVRRCALFDLLGECRTRGITHGDLDTGLGGIGSVDVVERVLHRSGREDREAFVLRERRREGRSAHDHEGGKNSGKTMHGGAPGVFATLFARANQALIE
jgi:hypothetical protein